MSWTNDSDRALRLRAAAVIPNGMYGHLSVRALPDDYPQFADRAAGAYFWDVDGNRYLDYMCAWGPNLFGYGHESIQEAFLRQLKRGDTVTAPGAVMVELAEAMTGMVSHADWAMFCKNGTDATTMAMMVARKHTRRKVIVLARGSYHGSAPWCTPILAGVTPSDRADQVYCTYNDVESLEAAVNAAGDDLAAVFATPIRHDAFVDQELPKIEYARRARELCTERGALLIVDDVRAGFRLARDCSWSLVGVAPDLSAWGKALANGHALSALLGSEIAREAAAAIYSTGSFWFAAAPMAAAVETLRLIRETDYLEHTRALGARLRAGLDETSRRHGFGLRQTGPAELPLVLFDDDPTFAKSYFWNADLLHRGVYFHPWHNMFLCAAMTAADIDRTIEAADDAFKRLKAAGPLDPPANLQILARAHAAA